MYIKKIIYWFLCLALFASVFSCKKDNRQTDEQPEETFDPSLNPGEVAVDVTSKDGVRDITHITNSAEVSMLFRTGDPSAIYTITYGVSGGVQKHIVGIKHGYKTTIKLDVKNYGQYKFDGYVFDVDTRALKHKFEETVWMKYEPAEVTSMTVVGTTRSFALEDNVIFLEKETGRIELNYSPASTFMNITCSSSDNAVIKVETNRETNGVGIYSVDFSVLRTGKANLEFVYSNGPEERTVTIPVDVRKVLQ